MTPTDESPSAATELGTFGRRAAGFVLIGVVLYVGLYVASERIIAEYAQRNRFYMVQTAPQARYDHVILGASHAAVFDYRDMNARLEAMTGARILNLSIVGAGITVNRLLLDYFLTEHHTDSVVYVLDSFGFYSAEWNEDRLQDAALLHRAPFDPALAWLLLRNPATRAVARDYVVGFSKINNPDRFVPDVLEGEGNRFDRTYRPVAQIDRQRIAYLYPNAIDDATLQDSPYLAALEDLIGEVQSRDIPDDGHPASHPGAHLRDDPRRSAVRRDPPGVARPLRRRAPQLLTSRQRRGVLFRQRPPQPDWRLEVLRESSRGAAGELRGGRLDRAENADRKVRRPD